MIARLCRADLALLSPVKHRSEATQRVLVRLKVREALVRGRVSHINYVRFLLKSLGVFIASSIKAMAFTKKARAQLNAANTALVEPLLQLIDALNAQIKQLDLELETVADDRFPVTQRLRQIAGVGPLTALCFVLTIESHERFAHARDVGAYLGLVPRRDQSGNSDQQLSITKAGHAQLRCLLVNCAHYIMGPFGPPSHLREADERIAARGGKSAKKRAVLFVTPPAEAGTRATHPALRSGLHPLRAACRRQEVVRHLARPLENQHRLPTPPARSRRLTHAPNLTSAISHLPTPISHLPNFPPRSRS